MTSFFNRFSNFFEKRYFRTIWIANDIYLVFIPKNLNLKTWTVIFRSTKKWLAEQKLIALIYGAFKTDTSKSSRDMSKHYKTPAWTRVVRTIFKFCFMFDKCSMWLPQTASNRYEDSSRARLCILRLQLLSNLSCH